MLIFLKFLHMKFCGKILLKKVITKKKEILISTGMSNKREVDNVLKIIKKKKNIKFSFLHCVSAYPAKIKECNLNSIPYLKNFKTNVGWSDHTVNSLLIYKLYKDFNVKLFELHFDLDGKG